MGGDWNTPSNWSTSRVPGPSDNAVINLPVTITSSGIALIACPVAMVHGATIDFIGGTNYLDAGAVITGGTVEVSGGGTYVRGAVTVTNLDVTAGAMVLAWHPGEHGTVTVTGNYAQGSAGTLSVEIASTTAYGQLHVHGAARLRGTLSVNNSVPYFQVPTVGDKFEILTFGSRQGDFATKTGVNLRNGDRLQPVYHAHDLTLVTVDPGAGASLPGSAATASGSQGVSPLVASSGASRTPKDDMQSVTAAEASQTVASNRADEFFQMLAHTKVAEPVDLLGWSM